MENNLLFNGDAEAKLIGNIDFSTINIILKCAKKTIMPNSHITIDLCGIQNGQTVILSLLMELQRIANAKNSRIKFTNLPDNLQGIAKLNGVLEFYQ